MRLLCYFLIVIFSCSLIESCKKSNNSGVPIATVDIYIYANNPSFVSLNVPGGWVYITGGVRDILVYRKSTSEFMAYDRNCTYHSSDPAPCATISVDASNIIAVDTCCHSKFSIYDGSVLQAPAAAPLKAYNTTYDGNVLHIFN